MAAPWEEREELLQVGERYAVAADVWPAAIWIPHVLVWCEAAERFVEAHGPHARTRSLTPAATDE